MEIKIFVFFTCLSIALNAMNRSLIVRISPALPNAKPYLRRITVLNVHQIVCIYSVSVLDMLSLQYQNTKYCCCGLTKQVKVHFMFTSSSRITAEAFHSIHHLNTFKMSRFVISIYNSVLYSQGVFAYTYSKMVPQIK